MHPGALPLEFGRKCGPVAEAHAGGETGPGGLVFGERVALPVLHLLDAVLGGA